MTDSASAGRQLLCARNGEEVMMVRTGDLVDGRAAAAIVGLDHHLVLTSAEPAVRRAPAAVSVDVKLAAALEREVDPASEPAHVAPVAAVRDGLALLAGPAQIVAEIDHWNGLAAVGG